MICPLYEEEDDFAWMRKGLENRRKAALEAKKQKTSEAKKARDENDCDSLLVGPGEAAFREVKKMGRSLVPTPPPMPKTVQVIQKLDEE